MPVLRVRFAVAGIALAILSGCAATGPVNLSPQQAEAIELRRYCERNPNAVEVCLGFLGRA